MTALEAAPDVGGTWYWNRYPGARCDVESVDYSYSFDENLQRDWQWSERFAAQPEILAYLRHVADRFDLRRHYRFGVDVVGAAFEGGRWQVDTATGQSHAAQFLLCATGCLSALNRPDIPGVQDFRERCISPPPGRARIPICAASGWGSSARDHRGSRLRRSSLRRPKTWSYSSDPRTTPSRCPTGRGRPTNSGRSRSNTPSGAAPRPTRRRARRTAATTRTPSTPTPRSGQRRCGSVGARAGFFREDLPDQTRNASANEVARKFAEERIREIVADPAVAADLIPVDHPIGTKRICTDDGYYATFNRDNVRLVNLRREPIEAITADAVRTPRRRTPAMCWCSRPGSTP